MIRTDELAYVSATDLAAKVRRRELSPVDLVEATIERIEERNPSINAFVFKGYDDARAAAKAAEQAVMSGAELGPLHGVPTAIKDLFDFKPGWKSTFGGIRALKDNVIDAYCIFAERVEAAGAILVGKTNSPVMGFRGTCDNYLFGPTSTPFDVSRNSGGSSGGGAAAVADGLVPFAEGTDGGGSIRIPASFCGVYGYKASFGRTPCVLRPDAFGGITPFIHEGPISRTVEDAALALTALAGYHPADPFSLDETIDFTAATRRSIKGFRIAYSPDLDVYPVDPRVAEVVRRAVDAFAEAGATVEEVKLGIERDQMELADLWCALIMPLNVATIETFKAHGLDILRDHPDDLPPDYRDWLERGYKLSAQDAIANQAVRTEVYDAVQRVLWNHDLLVSPTLACLPPENASDGDTKGPAEINGVKMNRLIGWCMTYFANYTGHPAASVPAGLADGLPVGMQIMGRRYADVDVLAASAVFERLRPWADTYDACRNRSLA
jgi:amidase/aspartyl-tRNA(Asn)/glutamyl-tRNA(Gln) amidotransferase subunit A